MWVCSIGRVVPAVKMKILGVKHNPLSLCAPQVNLTCTDLGSVLGLHGECPVANHPSEGTAG